MHVVVKHANLWDLMTISNTNECKTYITKDLGCDSLFTILVRLHTRHKLLLLLREWKSNQKDKMEVG
jgi:hypothetical protein